MEDQPQGQAPVSEDKVPQAQIQPTAEVPQMEAPIAVSETPASTAPVDTGSIMDQNTTPQEARSELATTPEAKDEQLMAEDKGKKGKSSLLFYVIGGLILLGVVIVLVLIFK